MIQHIFGTCTCYRITAKCRTMLTKSQHSGCLLIHQYCAHRKSATDTFCHSYYIWMYSKLLIAEKCTCTAHACLDLVYYKYQILLFTDVCDLFHKLRIYRNYSAFSLDQLDHNTTDRIINSFLQSFDISCIYKTESLCKWEEELMKHLLSCR